MKWKLIVLISILIFSCTKNNKNLCPEYNQFIGKWGNQIGDDKVQVEFFKNGKIEIQSSIQRRKILRGTSCQLWTNHIDSNWHGITIDGNKKKQNPFLEVEYNGNIDSIRLKTGDYIEDFTFLKNHKKNFLLRLK
jgi:hypothetical protein